MSMNIFYKPIAEIINHFGRKKEEKLFTKPPIYLGGCGRSGTTILLSILSSHPEIFAFGPELDMYKKTKFKHRDVFGPFRKDRLYRILLRSKVPETCNRWAEKTPRNIRNISVINSHHNGNYRFINIVRDGRDVILSKHPKSPDTYWVDPDRWIRDVSLGLAEIYNPRVHTLRYEDLITDFETEIKKICDFLDIPLCDEILNWHDHATVRSNKAYFGEVKSIFTSSTGKWKQEKNLPRANELQKIEEARKLLAHYGYDV